MDRDYEAEVHGIIEAEFTSGDVAGLVANRVVTKLRATDPALLAGWLDQRAQDVMRAEIGRVHASQRSQARIQGARSVFADVAAQAAEGDTGPMQSWLATYHVVNEDRVRRRLAEMTRTDLLYVADRYDASAAAAKLEAAFMRKLADRVPDGQTVGDVLTESQILALRKIVDA